ncbi:MULTISPECIES: hypothetical protein [unclassified Agarivorans]|uniref:hypothetical protein n=1 Tax=unclassified Agarivorans TaxID=2636026 RepID=UPI0026E11F5E|nr:MULTISPECIES: hypothetical protein [unclassified Agarivorans]MDO6685052.1 hypothetical protein [Agarivorans sp. 3_MG-2023]MDO6717390.1 hypothetical protein [Agarivorans sp. 2_MG-2023]
MTIQFSKGFLGVIFGLTAFIAPHSLASELTETTYQRYEQQTACAASVIYLQQKVSNDAFDSGYTPQELMNLEISYEQAALVHLSTWDELSHTELGSDEDLKRITFTEIGRRFGWMQSLDSDSYAEQVLSSLNDCI